MKHSLKDGPMPGLGHFYLFVEKWGHTCVHVAHIAMSVNEQKHIKSHNPAGPKYIPLPEEYWWEGPIDPPPEVPEEVRREWGKQMYWKETARLRS